MYKMSFYRFGVQFLLVYFPPFNFNFNMWNFFFFPKEYGPYGQQGIDRVRGAEVGVKNVKLSVVEEAFTSILFYFILFYYLFFVF